MSLVVTVPASTGDLTVLATLKTELQITGSDQDLWLANVICQASDAIATYCRQVFVRETVVQTERGGWDREAQIVLARPIKPSITSIVENGVTLTPVTEYELDGSILHRLYEGEYPYRSERYWDMWRNLTVAITYSAGYTALTDVPYDLERCCLDLCRHFYFGRARDPALRSERLLDISERSWFGNNAALMTNGIPGEIAQRLDPYRLSIAA